MSKVNPFPSLYEEIYRRNSASVLTMVYRDHRAANQVLSHPAIIQLLDDYLPDQKKEIQNVAISKHRSYIKIIDNLPGESQNPLINEIRRAIFEKRDLPMSIVLAHKRWINVPDEATQMSPLHVALMYRVHNKDPDDTIAVTLLECGADVRYVNPITFENTLHLASYPEILERARNAGVRVNSCDVLGRTPHMKFCEHVLGHPNYDFDVTLGTVGCMDWMEEDDRGMSLLAYLLHYRPDAIPEYIENFCPDGNIQEILDWKCEATKSCLARTLHDQFKGPIREDYDDEDGSWYPNGKDRTLMSPYARFYKVYLPMDMTNFDLLIDGVETRGGNSDMEYRPGYYNPYDDMASPSVSPRPQIRHLSA